MGLGTELIGVLKSPFVQRKEAFLFIHYMVSKVKIH